MLLILQCGSSKTINIAKALSSNTDFKIINFLSFSSKNLDKVTGIIISGAPILVTEENINEHLSVFERILNLNVPILGICFGHQLIGLHFGAIAYKMIPDRKINCIQVDNSNKLFNGLEKKLFMQEDHCEWITVPNNFIKIAYSNNCENEAMMHKSKSIFGVQFHPEVSGEIGHNIIQNFVRNCCELGLNPTQ